jgi:two-component system chemotaxis family response regulator WspR
MNIEPPPQMAGTASSQSIMVLLVDDQLFVGEAVRRSLIDQPGIEFHFCSNPLEALATARKVRPTVILQDLVMPEVSGLDLVRHYRADPATASIPIIVLSTKEEATVKSEAFLAGANDYLVKLPDRIELIARIRYHSAAYLSQLQRDEAYRALRKSQQELMETNLELQCRRADGPEQPPLLQRIYRDGMAAGHQDQRTDFVAHGRYRPFQAI